MNMRPTFHHDQFGIGQAKMAEITMAYAQKAMGEAAPEAFGRTPVDPEWRAMRRRQFAAAREEYERAKLIRSMFGGLH